MKKTLSLVLIAAIAMTSLVAAPKSKKNTSSEPVQPVSVKFSAETFGDDAQTLQDHVYNADGSVTYTAGFKYGGGGTSFLIDGKNGISAKQYRTIHVEFDWEVAEGNWSNPNAVPKFKIIGFGAGSSFYQGGDAINPTYFDSTSQSGSTALDIDISTQSKKVTKIGVLVNAWRWKEDNGGSEDDLVKITVKEITFLP